MSLLLSDLSGLLWQQTTSNFSLDQKKQLMYLTIPAELVQIKYTIPSVHGGFFCNN